MFGLWKKLQARERVLIVAAALVMGLVAAWLLVWEPLQESQAQLRQQLAQQRALNDWLDRLAPEIERLRDGDRVERSMEGRSALSEIDQSARAAGLAGALQRIEPGAGDQVRVVFEQAGFVNLMKWLDQLVATRPLAVESFSADRDNGGGRVDSVVVVRRSSG
ncbi:MAG: type II secretion system protein GspM [Wenzhouxiangellaceae bacterium]|nr:type II secretion system protein GspM [Wenzhouxiangellaceae bacterium]